MQIGHFHPQKKYRERRTASVIIIIFMFWSRRITGLIPLKKLSSKMSLNPNTIRCWPLLIWKKSDGELMSLHMWIFFPNETNKCEWKANTYSRIYFQTALERCHLHEHALVRVQVVSTNIPSKWPSTLQNKALNFRFKTLYSVSNFYFQHDSLIFLDLLFRCTLLLINWQVIQMFGDPNI